MLHGKRFAKRSSMKRTRAALALVPLSLLLDGCGGAPGLDVLAGSYVKLVLAVGRHDALYVDAYYGPPAWRADAAKSAPVPLPELLATARALRRRIAAAAGPADRKRYLDKQLVAIEAHLRRLSGERMTLTYECRALYDADPPHHDVAEFRAAHLTLETLVPGHGPLGPRIEAMRRAVYVPRERIANALGRALEIARDANAPFVRLPAGEEFETALVTGKPWGAYNWYLGDFKSRIELNIDLPTELNGLLGTMCHEGYPGHHVYNVLLEQTLVKGRGWVEYSVYPLYSPQSLLAEGTANVGIDVVFADDERRRALTESLAPAAGVPKDAILALDRIRDAIKPLKYVNGEAARMLVDEGRTDAEVATFIAQWGLVSEQRAKKSVEFAKTYRSYVFNYSLGEDLVGEWIGAGADRRRRFFELLDRPVVPSDLVRR
jgi:hypothetical protein